MPRMFRVLGFFCLLIALMFLWGDLYGQALLFFAQTVFFYTLSYIGLSERMYLNIFNAYLVLFFVVFLYWIFFQVDIYGPGTAGGH